MRRTVIFIYSRYFSKHGNKITPKAARYKTKPTNKSAVAVFGLLVIMVPCNSYMLEYSFEGGGQMDR